MIDYRDFKRTQFDFKYSLLVRAIISIYVFVLTVITSYYTSMVYYELLWSNERFAVVGFMTIAMLISYIYLAFSKVDNYRLIFAYHIILIITALLMLMPYEYRPLTVVVMILTYLFDTKVGIVANASVCGFAFFALAYEPEFFFTIIMLITGTFGCIIVRKYSSKVIEFIMYGVYIILSVGLHMIFSVYCKDSAYVDIYTGMGFVFKTFLGATLVITIFVIFKFLYSKFVLKASSEVVLKALSSDKAVGIRLIKEKSMPLYYHCKEVAELSTNAAIAIGANASLSYAGGMYHDFGKISGNAEYVKEGMKLAKKYNIPKDVKDIMIEHNVKMRLPKTKESAIVMMADTAVSATEYIRANKNNKEISEKTIIENALITRLSHDALKQSGLTLEEFYRIKDTFIKSKEM
ncbi:MAG: HDIG domain-containing protein [Clostridiales bacterium]|nr:HDIG domain-containing protein [Clostridiales bacterium]